MSNRENRRHGGVVGPVILIGLGVIFLLNNLGLLNWSVWEIFFRLWPILLVAVGLDLILGRRSIWGSLLAVVLTFAILGLAVWLASMDIGVARRFRTETVTQPLDQVDQAELILDLALGRLTVHAAPRADNLIEGTVDLVGQETLARTFDAEDGRSKLVLRSESGTSGPFTAAGAWERLWDLQLSPDVPLRLETNVGIGQQEIDLTGLALESLEVEHGIGQSRVTLSAERSFQARISGAIGQTVVVIPEPLAARVLLSTGLSGRQLPPDYHCDEDVCVSPDYDTADHRVDLEVSQAIGNLVITH